MARYLVNLLQLTVLLMWAPAVAFAAVVAATGGDSSPLAVPPALVIGSLIFSTMAGASTLAASIVKELRANPGQPLVAPFTNAVAHMLGSWLAGAAAFIAAMGQGSGVWTLLGGVLVASFIGSKGLEIAAQRMFPTFIPPKEPA